ncbi:hypothetical protein [Pseudomonas grimontii]|uniref:hypothetical protein n=1 Tax=Pseudomonas grimontii TaxID=129847 RepID=UPI0028ED8D5B|nr:hypothetical protein [Pseudomonas grimontii]
MPDNSNYKIATADALTLLLHNQHALSAAIEEITKWLSENGVGSVAAHAMSAMEALDANAQAITDSIEDSTVLGAATPSPVHLSRTANSTER